MRKTLWEVSGLCREAMAQPWTLNGGSRFACLDVTGHPHLMGHPDRPDLKRNLDEAAAPEDDEDTTEDEWMCDDPVCDVPVKGHYEPPIPQCCLHLKLTAKPPASKCAKVTKKSAKGPKTRDVKLPGVARSSMHELPANSLL